MKNREKLHVMRRFSLLIVLFGCAAAANAGNLYRCVGSDGIPNYTSKKVSGTDCKVVAKSAPAPAMSRPAQPAPVQQAASGTSTTSTAVAASTGTAPAKQTGGSAAAPKFLRMGYSKTYSYVDANGVTNYSNSRPKGVGSIKVMTTEYAIFSQPSCYACGLTSSYSFGSVKLNTAAFASEIKAAALAYGVEEAVVRAIIHAESAYRPHVQSNKGAQGLMQLIPATAKRFGVTDSFDPAQNINGGVQYLSWLLRRYKQDLTLAAAAYNAGEGAVDRYGGVPPYKETRLYVVRVGQLAERYRKVL